MGTLLRAGHRYLVAAAVAAFLAALLIYLPHPAAFWLQYWWMFPVALLIAIIVNTIGLSGAVLFVPFFILIFPFFAHPLSPLASVKLGLITESFGLSSSALAFFAFGLVDLKIARAAVLGALPFVAGGAVLSSFLPQTVLYLMIAALLVVSVILLNAEDTLKKRREEEQGALVDLTTPEGERVSVAAADGRTYRYCRTRRGYIERFFGYGAGGFFQGAAGFGIGELGIISMILTGIPTRIAIGTSHLIVATTAVAASLVHLSFSSAAYAPIPWNIPFMTVPAVVIGGQLAPYIAAKLPSKALSRFISAVFVVVSIALGLLAFGA